MALLDLSTVLVLHGTSLIAGAGTLAFVRSRAGRPSGLATVATAFMALAAGAIMAGLGELGAIPHFIWRDNSAALGTGAYILFLIGVCALDRDADHLRWLLVLPLAILVVGVATPVFANNTVRATVFHGAAALANLAAGLCIAGSRRREPLPSRLPLSAALLACGLVYAAQLPLLLTGLSTPGLVSAGLAATMMLNFAIAALLVSFVRERREEAHRRASDVDVLTGILNRRGFLRTVPDVITRSGALALFDLDHFKAINDRFGHAAGDHALLLFARLLKCHLGSGETMARIGGEEFVAFLPGASVEGAMRLVERIRVATLALAIECEGERITLATSAGLAVSDGAKPYRRDALLALADAALYRAKAEGRNRTAVATPDDAASARGRQGDRSTPAMSLTPVPVSLAGV